MARDQEKAAAKAAAKAERSALNRQRKDEAERQRQLQAWLASPQGRARTAWENGDGLFQISLSMAQTQQRALVLRSGAKGSTKTQAHEQTDALTGIEDEGWTLFQAGFYFHPQGSVSRDKFIASGQHEQVLGEVVGVYIFRRSERGGELVAGDSDEIAAGAASPSDVAMWQ